MNKIFISMLSASLVLAAGSCGKKGASSYVDKTSVIAVVNGEKITQEQFTSKAEKIEKMLGVNFDILEEKKKLLDNLITSTLIYQKALEEGMDKELEIKEYIATRYLKKKVPDTTVTDDEASRFFEANKNKYEKVEAAHILIKPKKPGDKLSEMAANRKAADLLVKILNGEDFGKLAKEYSEDAANAAAGGDLGFFSRGMMVKEFEEAAFSLKEAGDISKVIRTQYGYHIIKLLANMRGFETFKDQIKEKLRFDRQKNDYEAVIVKLKEGAKVSINDDALRDIKIVNEPLLLK